MHDKFTGRKWDYMETKKLNVELASSNLYEKDGLKTVLR